MREPPFCPNPHCHRHYGGDAPERRRWYRLDGVFHSRRAGATQRYRCRHCQRRFSASTFSLDYYAKRRIDLYRLRRLLVSGVSIRAAARLLCCAPASVSRRVVLLARQSIAAHAALSSHHRLAEALVADGFESFWVSQYHPNNFNLLCGSESQYVYAMTSVSLKRSGRMREGQRRRRDRIEARDGSDPQALERSFGELMQAAVRLWRGRFEPGEPAHGVLLTDEHKTYPRAILPARASVDIDHRTVSSHLARSRDNPLFAVNYIDREIRKDLAEHHRESVCFARNAAASTARMWVYLVWHNIDKPYRISPRSASTHAEVSGVARERVMRERGTLLRRRAFFSRCRRLSHAQRRDWLQLQWTPERENYRNRRVTPYYAAC